MLLKMCIINEIIQMASITINNINILVYENGD
jgi:hypothetical protein